MVDQNRDLLLFLNVNLIEIIEFILNYKKCLQGTRSVDIHNRSPLIRKELLRLKVIKSCLGGESSPTDFYEKCWFICESFKWNKISDLFDGNLKLLQTV